jgi:hypothetical protein
VWFGLRRQRLTYGPAPRKHRHQDSTLAQRPLQQMPESTHDGALDLLAAYYTYTYWLGPF